MHGLGDAKTGSNRYAVDKMNCELQAFRFDVKTKNAESSYRFAVIDSSKACNYPANFVCMLPLKIESVKGKSINTFGTLFGEKSIDFAIELLKKALLHEKDESIRLELKKRIKLLDPTQPSKVKCSECGKNFETTTIKRYKHPFCNECYHKRFSRKS
jgi:DNA-directed RNA polymerase subunit RPC12/RpoP